MRTQYAGSIRMLIAATVIAPPIAESGDIGSGHRLAEIWCQSCHQVGPEDAPRPTPGLPQLAILWSSDLLRKFLASGHENMPTLGLSRAQIDDIVAYVTSLRAK